jgi:hypothetical protein
LLMPTRQDALMTDDQQVDTLFSLEVI